MKKIICKPILYAILSYRFQLLNKKIWFRVHDHLHIINRIKTIYFYINGSFLASDHEKCENTLNLIRYVVHNIHQRIILEFLQVQVVLRECFQVALELFTIHSNPNLRLISLNAVKIFGEGVSLLIRVVLLNLVSIKAKRFDSQGINFVIKFLIQNVILPILWIGIILNKFQTITHN